MSKRARRKLPPLDDIALESLCEHLANGKSLRAWAEASQRDHSDVIRWVLADEGRTKRYREARRAQADTVIDELIELSDAPVPTDDQGRTDSAAVNQLRLRVDTRKWIAAKFYPALYGERVAVDANVNANLAQLPPDEILSRMAALLASNGLAIVPASSDGTDETR